LLRSGQVADAEGNPVSAVAESPSSLAVDTRMDQSVAVLTIAGVLDVGNAAALRDTLIKAVLEQPSAVVVDVNSLRVSSDSGWSTFLGVRWQLDPDLDIPLMLVCSQRATREAIARSGLTRFMPVYSTENGAMKALGRLTRRDVKRAETRLPSNLSSLRESRKLVREWLTEWSQSTLIPVALVVVNVFIENVLEHTGSEPVMRIETDGATATIAVSDANSAPALRLPTPQKGIDVSGLAIVEALSRAWGSTATSSGKTVWAIIGPENQL
jgi:anti-anti-sigma factor